MKTNASAIVVGAGIVGLATARAITLKGYKVTVIERSEKAVGASIRNFGMLWPIGQPDGALYQRAMRSKIIWKEIADSVGLWYDECGSLHVAHHPDEWIVLQELVEIFDKNNRPAELLSPAEMATRFSSLHTSQLLGGLYSPTETIVDPRQAIAAVAAYLQEYLDVNFIWGKNIAAVETGKVFSGKEVFEADLVVVCSGADFETLFQEAFMELAITKCKLQMMRFQPETDVPKIGTSVCGGLSLIHYNSFKAASSLDVLKKRYEAEMPEYLKWGIHVMVSQNETAELTVGDSHEYGGTFDPFDKSHINQMVLNYLKTFVACENWQLLQSWNGIYAKMKNGATEVFLNIVPGVYVLNGLGGAGMTLSFGLAEEKIELI